MIVELTAEEIATLRAMVPRTNGLSSAMAEALLRALDAAKAPEDLGAGVTSAEGGIDRTVWPNDAITITLSRVDRGYLDNGILSRLAQLVARGSEGDVVEKDHLQALHQAIRPPTEHELALREAAAVERGKILARLRELATEYGADRRDCTTLLAGIRVLEGGEL